MIVKMNRNATPQTGQAVLNLLKSTTFQIKESYGKETIFGVVNGQIDRIKILLQEYLEQVEIHELTSSYKYTSREFHPSDTLVKVDDVVIGGNDFITMAGPCSIESLDQIMECARIAKAGGAKILRGGAFKPRTSPYAFQGLGEEGLKYMRQASDAYGLKMITEVMDEANLELVCHYTDIIQIGARNMQNFRLLEAIGKTQKPVALKRGISGTIDEWLHAAEYIASQGNLNIIFVERGIRTYETATRNTLDLSAVPIIQKLSHFPIIVDPSHGVGVWEYIPPMAVASVATGASGMIVEIHPTPEQAWSDGPQSLKEDTYLKMMRQVDVMVEAMQKIREIE
ncbi:3-deoxy-7-phosphoheptulonate synthase [Vagococcus intermedius]|uniref:3-deoxy-7-phosphoheptulonate synthase n=1 Tax=Vagococcus intermedius TaxID=2991418 RepID=A0AAF0CW72_9ENTE|nr:3-deoxy-7-phosphoheptulonate synthase [Vagococcus intermedius]WEG74155.1 3-deoxy-7-phosphoheptulonate synthase [Vagococcus intermedius]WEG76235.1 3-deoxy-7-phosphoheptulonate synthase [Vagococcus intermedius]